MQKAHAYGLCVCALGIGAALAFCNPPAARAGDQNQPPAHHDTAQGDGPDAPHPDDPPPPDGSPHPDGPPRPDGPPHPDGPPRPGDPPRPEPPRPPRPPRIEGPNIEDMTHALQLTPQQQESIKAILDSTQKQIDAVLTPEQREKMQQFRDHHAPPPAPNSAGNPVNHAAPHDPHGQADAQDDDHGRPVELVAKELGVTPEQFRAAFKKVHPAGAGQEPTEEQRRANRKVLAETLGVSPERLDEVMDKYRPGGRGTNGPHPQPDH